MTPEERNERVDRLLEFLAGNEAELSASLQTLSGSLQTLSASLKTLSGSLQKLQGVVQENSEQIDRHSGQISQLIEVQMRTLRIIEAMGRQTEERFDRLAQAQVHTDERLNKLITVVERYFSNGKP